MPQAEPCSIAQVLGGGPGLLGGAVGGPGVHADAAGQLPTPGAAAPPPPRGSEAGKRGSGARRWLRRCLVPFDVNMNHEMMGFEPGKYIRTPEFFKKSTLNLLVREMQGMRNGRTRNLNRPTDGFSFKGTKAWVNSLIPC